MSVGGLGVGEKVALSFEAAALLDLLEGGRFFGGGGRSKQFFIMCPSSLQWEQVGGTQG